MSESDKRFKDYEKGFQARMVRTLFQVKNFQIVMAGVLDPECFESKTHRWVVRNALKYAKQHGQAVSLDALLHEHKRACKGGVFKGDEIETSRTFIKALDKPVKDRNYVQNEISSFVKVQDTKQRVLQLVDCLEHQKYGEIDKIFAEGQRIQNLGFGSLGHFYVKQRDERLHRRRNWVPNGIPTGWPVDQYLKPGGLPPKTLGCVLLPPGKGKTSSLVDFGGNAIVYGNIPVLHISCELSEEFMQDRYDAKLTKVQLNDLEDRKYRKRVWKKAGVIGEKFGECLVIKEFPAGTLTVAGIRAYIRQLDSVGFHPGIVIVDYADLLKASVKRDKKYEEIGDVYTDLRGLATELNVPVWTASQATREAFDKPTITMADFAASFEKAMVSDFVVALGQTKKEKEKRIARVYIAKNRFGPGEFELPNKVRVNWGIQSVTAV